MAYMTAPVSFHQISFFDQFPALDATYGGARSDITFYGQVPGTSTTITLDFIFVEDNIPIPDPPYNTYIRPDATYAATYLHLSSMESILMLVEKYPNLTMVINNEFPEFPSAEVYTRY
jgi:hypothetical protein